MRMLILLVMYLAAGCAAYQPVPFGVREDARRLGPRFSNEITREDLDASTASNALELIRSLRPEWLVIRDEWSITEPNDLVIYVNSARMGGRASLQEIPLGGVESVRYFESRDAYQRWGWGHAHGVILISTGHYSRE